jgi:glucose-1-phosphate thymidylyltransferase
MKAIIPLAGLGTRLRPHTLSRPKPLVQVAGKPVLGHVLDRMAGLPISQMIFITGYLGDQIESWVRANYHFDVAFVEQKELKGQAHAIRLAREYIDEPLLIVFVDTLFEADLSGLETLDCDGAILVKEVEDPSRFGVVVLEDGYVTRLVEKPKQPVSNLAVVGVYYLRDWRLFVECLDELIGRDIRTDGEYYLADALQLMVDKGARLRAFTSEVWEDTGTADSLLQSNRYLLGKAGNQVDGEIQNSVIIPPVYVGKGARLVNSVVGPNVTIADGAIVTGSVLTDCIIGEGAQVGNAILSNSLVGSNAVVQWDPHKVNLSDYSQLELG